MITAAIIALFKLPKKLFIFVKNVIVKIVETVKVLFVPDYKKKKSKSNGRPRK